MIFDCDGVLVDSEPLAATAYERAYGKHGLALDGGVIAQCIGMKQADIILRIAELTGHALPPHAEPDLWVETKQIFTERLKSTLEIAAFLEKLESPRCVASSSAIERIEHSLAITGLKRFFGDAIFSSSMVKRGKPAPDLFLYAAEKMGFEPRNCVVIEDSHFGIQGAVAAGMLALGYTGGGHTEATHAKRLTDAGAAATGADWTEIAALLREHHFA